MQLTPRFRTHRDRLRGRHGKPTWLGEMRRLVLRPGDVVVMTFPHDVPDEIAALLKREWEHYVPGTKCVVIGSGGRVGVLNTNNLSEGVAHHVQSHL